MKLRIAAGIVTVAVVLVTLTTDVFAAQSKEVVGNWITVDDNDGEKTSILKMWEKNGKLYGKVVRLLAPETPNPVCSECRGKNRDKPIEGMTILWGVTERDGGEWWEGGYILDPENGKVYRVKIRTIQGGSRLEVRGYLGVSLSGRTQIWERAK